ncbi:hypothetical protein QTN47_20460 [Danxiaibacter flavus]|uniref:Uncharacterized protein n=1 Tax=Danxiaibacter flavus TaxID=3049108 RepID=A0ABV3ZJ23_9BACT|nr:hypothetical protein QNM32_20465 [Chitinophagaceae bacterium DXS]
MKNDIIQQEILLLTDTTFSQRALIENDSEDEPDLSLSEKFEEAVWAGLLTDLLPEVVTNRDLRLWQVEHSEHSWQVELSKYTSREKPGSINPFYFLTGINYN